MARKSETRKMPQEEVDAEVMEAVMEAIDNATLGVFKTICEWLEQEHGQDDTTSSMQIKDDEVLESLRRLMQAGRLVMHATHREIIFTPD